MYKHRQSLIEISLLCGITVPYLYRVPILYGTVRYCTEYVLMTWTDPSPRNVRISCPGESKMTGTIESIVKKEVKKT